jgi:hypothetical protein
MKNWVTDEYCPKLATRLLYRSGGISLDGFIPRLTCHIRWMDDVLQSIEASPWFDAKSWMTCMFTWHCGATDLAYADDVSTVVVGGLALLESWGAP